MLEGDNITKFDVLPLKTSDKLDSEPQKQIGHWNDEEQKKYVIFVEFFKKELNSKLKRRNNKLFKIMSSFIETRNSVQCRCHHTKLIRTFKHVNKIVKNFQEQIGYSQYSQLQKMLISTHPIFNTNSKEFQQATKLISSKSKIKFKSIGIQTEEVFLENYQIPSFNTPSTLEPDGSILHYIIYPGPFLMFNDS